MGSSGTSRRFRRINLLWVLAALLGAAAIHTTATTIHHPEPSDALMAHFASVTAEYSRAIAEARLQAAAREVLASPPTSAALARQAVAGAEELFQLDLVRKRITARTMLAPGANPLVDSMLFASAALAERNPREESLLLHFVPGSTGEPRGVLLSLQRDSSGNAIAASGLTVSATPLLAQLFGAGLPPDTIGPLRRAGTSIQVGTADGPLFQSPGPLQPYRATIHPRGALSELAITTGLTAPSGLILSLHSASMRQLWISGLLLASTALVIVLAAASSRREALLARARSDFIAGVSHELRMPLAQIMLASETLAEEREQDPDARQRLATSIVREARRLAAQVDNVLLVARSGAVALRPTITAVDVGELYADVGDAVGLALEDAGQRLEVNVPTGLQVLGDRTLLRQALTNLIDNARKYGQPSQTIRLGAERNGGDGVRLVVEDQGPGIPPRLRARLLQAYERLPRDQQSERTGSGLGLAVTAQIARACGGSIRLEESGTGGARAVLVLQASPES